MRALPTWRCSPPRSLYGADAEGDLCLVEPAANRARSESLARAARTDPRHGAAVPAASVERACGREPGRASAGASSSIAIPVDPAKTNEAIERLVDARSDLTRTLTQLSLKLRLILSEEQWQELQRRRPALGNDASTPPESPDQK